MFMQTIDIKINGLKDQVINLSATADTDGGELRATIGKAQEALQQTIPLIQSVNNNMLVDFMLANIVILNQLQQVIAEADLDNKLLIKSSTSIRQIANAYQESIVPILTRLHNLSIDTDDMQKITAITALGNEIITCSSQINQFSDKFNASERIYTIFGIAIMLSSISLLIAILSKSSINMDILIAPTLLALGYNLCKKAMQAHVADISTDLIFTSVKKIEPLIYEVAKNDLAEQEVLINILHTDADIEINNNVSTKINNKKPDNNIITEISNNQTSGNTSTEINDNQTDNSDAGNASKPTIANMPANLNQETQNAENVSFGRKIKNIFDMFNPKK